MLAILIAYYTSANFAAGLDRLAHFKQQSGLAFVIAAGILAGAILPELFLIFFFQKGKLHRQNFRNLAFTVPTWAIDALLVDLMYRANMIWFGDAVTVGIVFAKICVDQLGYNPFFAAPAEVLVYEWKNDGFSWSSVKRAFTWNHYRDKIVPTLLATWVVWVPLMAIIYSLPYPLQFPLFSLALTFWVLLLTYMTNRFAGKIEADAPLALSTVER
ncbi:MAG: hypothetical protein QOG48_2191 [Verrucomicrobiota bacterium]